MRSLVLTSVRGALETCGYGDIELLALNVVNAIPKETFHEFIGEWEIYNGNTDLVVWTNELVQHRFSLQAIELMNQLATLAYPLLNDNSCKLSKRGMKAVNIICLAGTLVAIAGGLIAMLVIGILEMKTPGKYVEDRRVAQFLFGLPCALFGLSFVVTVGGGGCLWWSERNSRQCLPRY